MARAQLEVTHAGHAKECGEKCTKRLEPFGREGYSQNDEDGIIAEIFRRIGTTNKKFVEFGTGDGTENNTLFLLKQDWSGLWLEGSKDHHENQKAKYSRELREGRLTTVNAFLTVENIDSVIVDAGFSGEIDLLSIDVDGNDYHLWEAIYSASPRVAAIDYNAYVPPPVRWFMEYNETHAWDGTSTAIGASLQSLVELGFQKGYHLVGCNIVGLNAFFVRSDLIGKHFTANNSTIALHHPRRWWLDRVFHHTTVA
jgi:hypothetical protein